MIIKNQNTVPVEKLPDLPGVKKQILIGQREGSQEIIMRYFSLEPGSATPYHTHDFPHVVKVEKGEGVIIDSMGNEYPLLPGEVIYVPDNELHGFRNLGTDNFEFICIVPARGEK